MQALQKRDAGPPPSHSMMSSHCAVPSASSRFRFGGAHQSRPALVRRSVQSASVASRSGNRAEKKASGEPERTTDNLTIVAPAHGLGWRSGGAFMTPPGRVATAETRRQASVQRPGRAGPRSEPDQSQSDRHRCDQAARQRTLRRAARRIDVAGEKPFATASIDEAVEL